MTQAPPVRGQENVSRRRSRRRRGTTASAVTAGPATSANWASCQNPGMPAPFDLIVRGATLVSPGRQEATDIAVRDGRIAQIGGDVTGLQEIRADGLLALPGGIDAHVHLVYQALAEQLRQTEPAWVDDFWTGSLAAIAGGITTVGNMTFPLPGESAREAIAREMAGAAPEAAVDWFLHPVLTDLAAAAGGEIAALAADGHLSFKIFLTMPEVAADQPGLLAAAGAARQAGALTLLHCEEPGLLERTGQQLIAQGRGAVANFADA